MASAQLVRDEQLSSVNLCLPYRKDRNYIHSADIYQALTSLARDRFDPDAFIASLILRRQAAHQIQISFHAEPSTVGTFSIRYKEEQTSGWLIETTEKVSVRVPYDESQAAAAVIERPKYAQFSAVIPGYTTFEQLIVLLKAASGQGKCDAWLCQVKLQRALRDSRPLAVNLRQRIDRFFAFEIVQDDLLAGSACAFVRS